MTHEELESILDQIPNDPTLVLETLYALKIPEREITEFCQRRWNKLVDRNEFLAEQIYLRQTISGLIQKVIQLTEEVRDLKELRK